MEPENTPPRAAMSLPESEDKAAGKDVPRPSVPVPPDTIAGPTMPAPEPPITEADTPRDAVFLTEIHEVKQQLQFQTMALLSLEIMVGALVVYLYLNGGE